MEVSDFFVGTFVEICQIAKKLYKSNKISAFFIIFKTITSPLGPDYGTIMVVLTLIF